ncbi:stage III sporulation protein SpoIIIAB [Clostridium ganghwense]|uniref:Stage III sporulation protein SpoIIIAB n=1 Tax=Clostridium ganghwense TaxID=312089 RepID=A0ABT4CN00_9CLOT|nr:stage III sporulation protein SpoIIIAB [Clostridium ganghwense]MCY6370323.1 stage III sporulation protein SpoIIIAB [Clostridium ganghwense]
MFLKTLGCILILVSCSLIGFIYGENLRSRVIQLKEIEQALYQLESEIVYTRTSLPEIFEHIGEKCNKPIKNIFLEVSQLLDNNEVDSVYEGFKKSIECNKELINLKKEDIRVLLDLARTLGESDVEGQKSILSLSLTNLKKQVNAAEVVMQKNIKMYRYLGFSLGAILVIMIV